MSILLYKKLLSYLKYSNYYSIKHRIVQVVEMMPRLWKSCDIFLVIIL